MYRLATALIMLALFVMPMHAADQAATATESTNTLPSKSMQRGYFGAKGGIKNATKAEATTSGNTTMDKCEACKAAKRESMRGPKGGYLVPKGTTYYAIEKKISDACRAACGE